MKQTTLRLQSTPVSRFYTHPKHSVCHMLGRVSQSVSALFDPLAGVSVSFKQPTMALPRGIVVVVVVVVHEFLILDISRLVSTEPHITGLDNDVA